MRGPVGEAQVEGAPVASHVGPMDLQLVTDQVSLRHLPPKKRHLLSMYLYFLIIL